MENRLSRELPMEGRLDTALHWSIATCKLKIKIKFINTSNLGSNSGSPPITYVFYLLQVYSLNWL